MHIRYNTGYLKLKICKWRNNSNQMIKITQIHRGSSPTRKQKKCVISRVVVTEGSGQLIIGISHVATEVTSYERRIKQSACWEARSILEWAREQFGQNNLDEYELLRHGSQHVSVVVHFDINHYQSVPCESVHTVRLLWGWDYSRNAVPKTPEAPEEYWKILLSDSATCSTFAWGSSWTCGSLREVCYPWFHSASSLYRWV